ncbi:MAG TPA: phage tail tube protein [Candidatus Nanoarchaeia archaeon]|nr:phage tail tube protein [Candidatus Nanoarchaeia archaeon]
MSCRQIWEDIYGIEILPAAKNTVALALAASSDFGTTPANSHGLTGTWAVAGSNNLLPVDSYPQFKAPRSLVEKKVASGSSTQNFFSFTSVGAQPVPIVVPFLANAHNLTAFFKLLFQDNVSYAQGVTNTDLEIATHIPYDSGCATAFANLIRIRQDGDETLLRDQKVSASIVSRITLKGAQGGLIEGEVEFLAAKWEQIDAGATLVARIQDFDSTPALKFEDLTVLGSTGDTTVTELNIAEFDITFNNNAKPFFYNEAIAKTFTLGTLEVTGSLTIPWNDESAHGGNATITQFVANTTKVFSLVWGKQAANPLTLPATGNTLGVDVLTGKNSLTDNFFAIHANLKVEDYEETDQEENPMIPLKFRMVKSDTVPCDSVGTLKVLTGYKAATTKWGSWV